MGIKKMSDVESVPAWIVQECERWRMQQIRSGRFPEWYELDQMKNKLMEKADLTD